MKPENPSKEDVTKVLDTLDDSPRSLARRLVRGRKRFISDAGRQKLPVSNQHGEKVAPVLDVDAVLKRSERLIERITND